MTKICVPELGEDIETATIVEWHVHQGDVVDEGDEIVELVTDKATFVVEAPATGEVTDIYFEKGDEVAIGATLGVIR